MLYDFLLRKNARTEFEEMNCGEFDRHLEKYYVEMRSVDGSLYKK